MDSRECLINELEEIDAFFSFAWKIHKMAEDCITWLVDSPENKELNVVHSDNTNTDWSIINYFCDFHREGKYFSTDNRKNFWFLGVTADTESDFSFSLAYNGEVEKLKYSSIKKSDYKKIGDWIYFKLDKSIICKENIESQKENLRHIVKELLDKLLGIGE